MNTTTIEYKLTKIAEANNKLAANNERSKQPVTFSAFGMGISNPFMCEDMVDAVNPIEYYGMENCLTLIEKFETKYGEIN